MTIEGTDFGTLGNVINVLFPNAHLGSSLYLEGLDDEYIEWTDTRIKVKVPSHVTENMVNPSPAGSGIFKIEIKSIDSPTSQILQSTEILDIEYTLLNKNAESIHCGSETKELFEHAYLVKTHCDGIVFTLDANVLLYEHRDDFTALIELVLTKWSGILGIDLSLEKNSEGAYTYFYGEQDGNKNLITIPEELFNQIDYLTTQAFSSSCWKIAAGAENDLFGIVQHKLFFNPNFPWSFSTSGDLASGEVDVYEVLLHEFGHSFGLEHSSHVIGWSEQDGLGVVHELADRHLMFGPTSLSCDTCLTVTTFPNNSISYTVSATDSNGCEHSETIFIQVDFSKGVFIPSAFSS